jgi:hypothetical protein
LTIARYRPHQEEIMHPAILRQLAADHIKAMHARADDQRQARRARRRAPSMTRNAVSAS